MKIGDKVQLVGWLDRAVTAEILAIDTPHAMLHVRLDEPQPECEGTEVHVSAGYARSI